MCVHSCFPSVTYFTPLFVCIVAGIVSASWLVIFSILNVRTQEILHESLRFRRRCPYSQNDVQ